MDEALVWNPTEDFLSKTNLYALMQEQSAKTYQEIHQWSVDRPEAFVERTVKTLGIKLHRPYEKVLDVSAGPAHAKWLAGAKMNIAESCFKGPFSRLAIVTRRHDGELETITESALDLLSNRVANGLVALGFGKGDAVAIDMPMTAESVAIYLGTLKAGMVVISIPDSLPPEQVALRLKIGDAKAVFTQSEIVRDGKRLPLYAKIAAPETQAPQTIVLFPKGETPGIPLRKNDLLWENFLSINDTFEPVHCSPQDSINIIFSSGTTGTPKAIPWDHTTAIKAAADGLYHQDIRQGDVVCWPTNLGWMMGPWLIFASLINGAAIALYEGTPNERGFCEFVQNANVTMLGLVPSIVVGWRNSGKADRLDWSSIRCFSSSGEASNPELYSWLMTLNQKPGVIKPVVEYCGGTEIGGGYISGNLVSPCTAAQFNAAAMGIRFVVLDEKGNPCPAGETGEVYIAPPALGLSVRLHKGDHDAAYYAGCRPGLRKHGDLLTCLGNSRWKSCGRAGNDMNLGGIKVGSTEIEQIVNKIEGVIETAAIGVPAPGGGPDRLVIYAVTEKGKDLTEDDREILKTKMRQAVKTRLNPLFHVHDVIAIDALPRTASHKVMHRELRAQHTGSDARGPSAGNGKIAKAG